MRSLKTARAICQKENFHSLLLGSSRRVSQLTNGDQVKIAAALSLSPTEISTVSTNTKKCFVKNVGYEGVVLSSNDNIIMLNGSETVVCVEQFLSVRCEGQLDCHLLGEGTVKPFHLHDNGQIVLNYWSGFPKVQMQSVGGTVFFPTEHIKRKIMLYDCGNNTNIATVVDFMRQLRSLPYEIIVPVYPEKEDMLLIQGEFPGDIWHGKVSSINRARHQVDVFFFVEKHHPGRFERETFGRAATNTVSLDSVTGVACGHWISANCWQKTI